MHVPEAGPLASGGHKAPLVAANPHKHGRTRTTHKRAPHKHTQIHRRTHKLASNSTHRGKRVHTMIAFQLQPWDCAVVPVEELVLALPLALAMP